MNLQENMKKQPSYLPTDLKQTKEEDIPYTTPKATVTIEYLPQHSVFTAEISTIKTYKLS